MKSKREQSKARVEFRIHLYVFIIVMAFLALIDLISSPEHIWFIWPLLGWGIGITIHGLTVYYASGRPSLKDRMIEKEMNKL